MSTTERLAKLKKKAPQIRTQAHLERIIGSFQAKDRPLVISDIRGMLPERLEAKEPEQVEVKPKDPENPTIQEATAIRLNQQVEKILEQSDTIAEHAKTIQGLQEELAALKGLLDEKENR